MLSDAQPLLILGAPRSGTSLLCSMLAVHPDVAMLFEEFHGAAGRLIGKKVVGVKLVVPVQIDLYKIHAWRRLVHPLLARLRRRWKFPLRHVYTSHLSIRDYQRWPGMVVLCVVRQPGPTIDSIIKRSGAPRGDAFRRWRRAVRVAYRLHKEPNSRCLVVSFERLVTRPEEVMRAVLEQLGLVYDPVVLQGHGANPIYKQDQIDAGKAGDAGPDAWHDVYEKTPQTREEFLELVAASL